MPGQGFQGGFVDALRTIWEAINKYENPDKKTGLDKSGYRHDSEKSQGNSAPNGALDNGGPIAPEESFMDWNDEYMNDQYGGHGNPAITSDGKIKQEKGKDPQPGGDAETEETKSGGGDEGSGGNSGDEGEPEGDDGKEEAEGSGGAGGSGDGDGGNGGGGYDDGEGYGSGKPNHKPKKVSKTAKGLAYSRYGVLLASIGGGEVSSDDQSGWGGTHPNADEGDSGGVRPGAIGKKKPGERGGGKKKSAKDLLGGYTATDGWTGVHPKVYGISVGSVGMGSAAMARRVTSVRRTTR